MMILNYLLKAGLQAPVFWVDPLLVILLIVIKYGMMAQVRESHVLGPWTSQRDTAPPPPPFFVTLCSPT